jgi:hypothetical protein
MLLIGWICYLCCPKEWLEAIALIMNHGVVIHRGARPGEEKIAFRCMRDFGTAVNNNRPV